MNGFPDLYRESKAHHLQHFNTRKIRRQKRKLSTVIISLTLHASECRRQPCQSTGMRAVTVAPKQQVSSLRSCRWGHLAFQNVLGKENTLLLQYFWGSGGELVVFRGPNPALLKKRAATKEKGSARDHTWASCMPNCVLYPLGYLAGPASFLMIMFPYF